jgi:hypothetical protein
LVGGPITVTNQTVSNGLFTTNLDFGTSAFQGDARWLQIAVRQSGGGSYTTLSPRQALTAAPYALSLIPGAYISGSSSSYPMLRTYNGNGYGALFSSGSSIGLIGTGNSTGVYGEAADNGVTGIATSTYGIGVRGQTNSGNGVYGQSNSSGFGVQGYSVGNSGGYFTGGGPYGLQASSTVTNGVGILGTGGPGGSAVGVHGQSNNGYGVYGTSNTSIGMFGQSNNSYGVYGQSSANHGIYGITTANGFSGVIGIANGGPQASGVWGTSSSGVGVGAQSTTGNGVYGTTAAGASNNAGVVGESTGTDGNGVLGFADTGTNAWGVWGQSGPGVGVSGQSASGYGGYFTSTVGTGVRGAGGMNGVQGNSTSSGASGVYGENTSGGYGVAGRSNSASGVGVYGQGTGGWAGWFDGDVNVTGSCCAASEGSFKIDHPLDPQNKYLVQSAVESADMMSIYNGNVTTDSKGEAVVTLPDYVEALNKDFRYQLTPIGQFAQAIVASEVKDNRFTIKTDKPNVKVSWQVTGIRKDPYAQAHSIQTEVEKPAEEKGKYLHPELYGQPESRSINHEPQPALQPEPSQKAKPKP